MLHFKLRTLQRRHKINTFNMPYAYNEIQTEGRNTEIVAVFGNT